MLISLLFWISVLIKLNYKCNTVKKSFWFLSVLVISILFLNSCGNKFEDIVYIKTDQIEDSTSSGITETEKGTISGAVSVEVKEKVVEEKPEEKPVEKEEKNEEEILIGEVEKEKQKNVGENK